MLRYAGMLCLVIIVLTGCSSKDVPPPVFDGERAYRYLLEQVEFGPRVPGSRASAICRDYLIGHFGNLGFDVDSQFFTYFDPYSSTDTPMVNLVISVVGDGSDPRTILLMAHYDSRPRTDYATDTSLLNEPIDGANDGASGVALLMELANLFAERHPPANVDLVLVDGEDWGKPGDRNNYLLGSKHFANQGIRGRYYFGIVVDMIGDADQTIYREEYSQRFNPTLNDYIWNTASNLGVTTFLDSAKYSMIDDHLSLNVGGVPTVVIIDFDYPYWHTEFDTPDRCSAVSLSNVGRVVAKIVYTPSSWPGLD